ncbi:MAG: leucine-rich repeat protein [Clostridiales bacterium]|nr:leucine-rich repeat protein [Candidatus Equinaster intestinalis]
MKKIKFTALLLVVIMVISVFPFTALAAGNSCGESATWSFDSATGKLTISGSGDIADYTSTSKAPWSGKTIKSIEIGEGITAIGDYAFCGCSDALSVTIPDGVQRIGKYSFDSCYGLVYVSLPETVSVLDDSAFRYCNNLISVNIPAKVETIGNYAFGWCARLSDVKISAGVKTVGAYAFYLCNNLGEITIPNTVTTFGEAAFYYCRNLMSIKLPEGVTVLPAKMFGGCESLKKAILPISLTAIKNQAFENCISLASMNIPSAVSEIGASAFSGCEKLSYVNIPDGIEKVETEVFKNCYAITSINFPASITAVEKGAFDGCLKLNDIYYDGTAAMKKLITIATYNNRLSKATWHYVICEMEGHSIVNEWIEDGVHHWHICEVCEEKFDYGEHTGGTATLTDKAVCEECGKEYGEKLEYITVSGEIKSFGSESDEILVRFYKNDEEEPIYEKTVIGNTVKFDFPEIEPGEYTVALSKKNNVTRKYTVSVADRNVVFNGEIHLRGDGNGDGAAGKADMANIKDHINRVELIEGYEFDVLDLDGNGKINKVDFALIKDHINLSNPLY